MSNAGDRCLAFMEEAAELLEKYGVGEDVDSGDPDPVEPEPEPDTNVLSSSDYAYGLSDEVEGKYYFIMLNGQLHDIENVIVGNMHYRRSGEHNGNPLYYGAPSSGKITVK